MAVKKSAGKTKSQDESAPKAGVKKGAAKKEAAPKKQAAAPTSSAPAAPKKAAAKKAAAAPIKLTTSQSDLLQKIGGASDPGYRSEKKAEHAHADALQDRKLIKKGASTRSRLVPLPDLQAGKKHLGSQPAGGTGRRRDRRPRPRPESRPIGPRPRLVVARALLARSGRAALATLLRGAAGLMSLAHFALPTR